MTRFGASSILMSSSRERAKATMNDGQPLRIGVAGCGRIADLFHLPILAAKGDVRVTALVDQDATRLDLAGRRVPDAARLSDFDALVERADVDAVVICLPPAAHGSAACAAFAAGKHVYLEKPIATTMAEADAVVNAQRRAGTVGMVGFNFRYNAAFDAARELVQAGVLGKLLTVRSTMLSAARELPAWKRTKSTGGGALLDLGSHHLDLVPWVTSSEVIAVGGSERSVLTPGDTVSVDLELRDGVTAQLIFSLVAGVSANRLEFVGTTGSLRVDAADPLPLRVERPIGRLARVSRAAGQIRDLDPRRLLRSPGREPSFAAALDAFVRACKGAERNELVETRPDMEAGRASLALVAAAEIAFGQGRTVRLPLRSGSGVAPAAMGCAA